MGISSLSQMMVFSPEKQSHQLNSQISPKVVGPKNATKRCVFFVFWVPVPLMALCKYPILCTRDWRVMRRFRKCSSAWLLSNKTQHEFEYIYHLPPFLGSMAHYSPFVLVDSSWPVFSIQDRPPNLGVAWRHRPLNTTM